ncbi:putative gypsy retrotransposon integrase-like protein 1-like [Apostichopus japonicus]|uniref:Putative gypsy retrotransposon integrase-like protein 1-like n=1 Tax=Stichopus japonicus TaxID=307972 RepID=A0A2G8JUU0_STIJA|nr:putative gypsy retrotransposon integrase-like protein 1-like [Apostichopus japonicus]
METEGSDRFADNVRNIFDYCLNQAYPEGLSRDQKKEFRRKCRNFTIKDGALFYIGHKQDHMARVISSREEQQRIVAACHKGLGDTKEPEALSGHFGRDKTQARIKERFYWPTITKDVHDFLRTCDTCQRVNKAFKKVRGELQPLPVKPEAFQRIGIDLVGPLPKTREGYQYFATAICAYTKWVESEPLKSKSATEVAQFIYRIICRHGCPQIQLSDQGREFVNRVSEELHRLTGVDHRITTAYHPQCNGLAEKRTRPHRMYC